MKADERPAAARVVCEGRTCRFCPAGRQTRRHRAARAAKERIGREIDDPGPRLKAGLDLGLAIARPLERLRGTKTRPPERRREPTGCPAGLPPATAQSAAVPRGSDACRAT